MKHSGMIVKREFRWVRMLYTAYKIFIIRVGRKTGCTTHAYISLYHVHYNLVHRFSDVIYAQFNPVGDMCMSNVVFTP